MNIMLYGYYSLVVDFTTDIAVVNLLISDFITDWSDKNC